jgi:hypothetical protein
MWKLHCERLCKYQMLCWAIDHRTRCADVEYHVMLSTRRLPEQWKPVDIYASPKVATILCSIYVGLPKKGPRQPAFYGPQYHAMRTQLRNEICESPSSLDLIQSPSSL